mmetsp:Transcript_123767/g.309406  ORF Transcript_123767/g.309406 Transcript_123767/m.309406 type:complete len:196 (-) Transcript_123767:38-625(-)
MLDLLERMRARGCCAAPPSSTDPGRECGPPGPGRLAVEDGSRLVQRHMRGFAMAVLSNRTVAELREVCRLRALPTHGAKDDLLRRLVSGAVTTAAACSLGSAGGSLGGGGGGAVPGSGQESPAQGGGSGAGSVCTPQRRRRSLATAGGPSFHVGDEEKDDRGSAAESVVTPSRPVEVQASKRRRLSVKGSGAVGK